MRKKSKSRIQTLLSLLLYCIYLFFKLCSLPFCFLTECGVCLAWTLQYLPVWQPRRMETISQKYRLAWFWIETSPKSGSWCGEIPPQSRKWQRDDFFSECCGSSSAPRFYPRSWGCTRAARVELTGCHPSNRHAGQRTGARGLSWARARLVTCLDAADDFTHRKTSYFMLHTSGICILCL